MEIRNRLNVSMTRRSERLLLTTGTNKLQAGQPKEFDARTLS